MAVQGGQVIERIARLLRVVSEHSDRGVTTTELARQSELTRPTAHRMLSSLLAEGFVDHDPARGRWRLGPEFFFMGAVAAAHYDIRETAAPHLRAIAQVTGESAFLSARRGDETVCLLREEGSFPLRSFVLFEGVRFPLGVASAGMAILAYLPDAEITIALSGRDLTTDYGATHSTAAVVGRIAQTRRDGWSLNEGLILEGSWGMGAAVFDKSRHPRWALSVTGVDSRFSLDRQKLIGRVLLEHAHQLGLELQKMNR